MCKHTEKQGWTYCTAIHIWDCWIFHHLTEHNLNTIYNNPKNKYQGLNSTKDVQDFYGKNWINLLKDGRTI